MMDVYILLISFELGSMCPKKGTAVVAPPPVVVVDGKIRTRHCKGTKDPHLMHICMHIPMRFFV